MKVITEYVHVFFFLVLFCCFFPKFPTMKVIYCYYQTKKKNLNIFKDEDMPVQKVISRSFSIRSR